MLDRLMTKLAYSRILTERFQAMHLLINYSILALALVIYLIVGNGWIIFAGALPGALIFLVSVQAWSYRKAIEGGDIMEMIQTMMPR